MKAVAEELGLGFAGIGFQPKWSVAETPIMPKVAISYTASCTCLVEQMNLA